MTLINTLKIMFGTLKRQILSGTLLVFKLGKSLPFLRDYFFIFES